MKLGRDVLYPEVAVILGDPQMPDATKVGNQFSQEDLEAVQRLIVALEELAPYRFVYLSDHVTLLEELRNRRPSFILNFCDTGYRNIQKQELHVPAYLEILGIPYSGAPPAAIATCYDKSLVRAVAAPLGIPVPEEIFLRRAEFPSLWPKAYPVIIKPNRGDGSLGINQHAVAGNEEEARAQLKWLRDELPGCDTLVQEFLPGQELSVCLIGNPGFGLRALPVLEVDYSQLPQGLPQILSYESKTIPESPYWTQIRYAEAQLPEEVQSRLIGYSELLFERFSLRDYGRFDFRTAADGTIKLMEVNPNPAWCWDGKMNLMAGFGGESYADLLGSLLSAAQKRVYAVSEGSVPPP